jgi:hypothetical protein
MIRSLYFVAVLLAAPLDAQVNIERLRRDVGTAGWSASSTADLAVHAGNVDLMLLGLGTRLDHVGAATHTMLVLSGDFGWQRGERFSNRGLAHLRRAFGSSRTIHPEAFGQIDYDRSRSLAFRALVGAGPRAELAHGETARVSAGTAYLLEHERLDLPVTAAHPRRTTHHRWSSYVAASFGSGDPLHAGVTAYVQPRLDAFEDVRLLLDGSVAARAGGPASLLLTVALRYDSRPPDGARPLDATLKGGIGIQW